ncbi:MAG: ATP-binding protein [Chloroflexota bacterium]
MASWNNFVWPFIVTSSDATPRRHGGAGLGLAISRRFVELHKGRIWVESQENGGSTFYFGLPISDQQPDTNMTKYNWKMVNNKSAAPMNHNILLAVTRNSAAMDVLTHHPQYYRTVLASSLESARIMAQDLLPHFMGLPN